MNSGVLVERAQFIREAMRILYSVGRVALRRVPAI